MYTALDWPWGKALAVSPTGHVLQVEDILFGTVKERLAELGIRVGSVVECLGSEELDVRVRLPDGRVVRVSRAYAWFVCTKIVLQQRASPWGGGHDRREKNARMPAMAGSVPVGLEEVG